MAKVAHWIDFARFITDQDFLSRWDYSQNLNPEDPGCEYFLKSVENAQAKKVQANYDFDVYDPQVFSKHDNVNWEHDGEPLSHFFKLWMQGKRV